MGATMVEQALVTTGWRPNDHCMAKDYPPGLINVGISSCLYTWL